MNKHPNENIGEDWAYLFLELENPDFESTMMSAIAEIMANHSDEQERVQKSVSTEDMARAEARGLVPQSGNWKKPKRWVRPKGAVISKTRKKAHDDLILTNSTKEAMKSLFGEDFDRSTFQDMFSISLDDFSTELHTISGRRWTAVNTSLDVEVHIKDLNGERIGKMYRVFSRTDNLDLEDGSEIGELNVSHYHFYINSEHRGKGIASDIMENAEKEYEKLGVNEINLTANAHVGGYAWARQGYDFRNDKEKEKIQNLFKKSVTALHEIGMISGDLKPLLETVDSFNHSWEFASWNPSGYKSKLGDSPDDDESFFDEWISPYDGSSEIQDAIEQGEIEGWTLGKVLLIGTSWEASKSLDKKSAGYQIGKAYFAAKRNTPITG